MSQKHPGRPRQIDWPQCKAEGCNRNIKGGSRGFCFSHYMSARRGYLDIQTGKWTSSNGRNRIGSFPQGQICIVPKCIKEVRTKNLCNKHYIQLRVGIIDDQGNVLRGFKKRPRRDRWVGKDGYVLVPAPSGHPYARVDGSILEHRLVMEKYLGCYLNPDEYLVHHVNGIRSDNTPNNLEVLSAHARHGEGHPPGSAIPTQVAIQVLLQQENLPSELRQWLEWYKMNQQPQRLALVI